MLRADLSHAELLDRFRVQGFSRVQGCPPAPAAETNCIMLLFLGLGVQGFQTEGTCNIAGVVGGLVLRESNRLPELHELHGGPRIIPGIRVWFLGAGDGVP